MASDSNPDSKRAALSQTDLDAACEEFSEILRGDIEGILNGMRERGKVVLNSDDLFKMLPRYADNPAERMFLGPRLYDVAAGFTDRAYQWLLSRQVDSDDTVVFTAGGSAAGKSTILRAVTRRAGVDFIVDTTFSNPVRAPAQVESALAAGRKVEIQYLYRSFSESVRAMLLRALDPRSGRIVPIDDMARTHHGAQRTILEVRERYRDNGRVSVVLNANKPGGKLFILGEKEFFERLHRSVDNLQKKGQFVLNAFCENQRAKRGDDGHDQNIGRKELHVSADFYEAARSKAQKGRSAPGTVNA